MEESRHSIMVDSDPAIKDYLSKHINNNRLTLFDKQYEIVENLDINSLLRRMNQ
jgi:hypothetical protein